MVVVGWVELDREVHWQDGLHNKWWLSMCLEHRGCYHLFCNPRDWMRPAMPRWYVTYSWWGVGIC